MLKTFVKKLHELLDLVITIDFLEKTGHFVYPRPYSPRWKLFNG